LEKNMAGRLIYGWTEADVRQVVEAYDLDKSVIDESFLAEVSERVHRVMDELYSLDALVGVVQEVARERATARQ